MRARRRSAGDDSTANPAAYERIALGLADKLLSYSSQRLPGVRL